MVLGIIYLLFPKQIYVTCVMHPRVCVKVIHVSKCVLCGTRIVFTASAMGFTALSAIKRDGVQYLSLYCLCNLERKWCVLQTHITVHCGEILSLLLSEVFSEASVFE